MPRERGQRRIAACWFCIPIGFFFLALAVPSFLFFRQHAGHSLGAAVALDFAARHRVERVVAIASFTTLREEAARVVGRELARLLRENYDNRENLSRIARHNPKARIGIFHGMADNDIPVEMGGELAREFPFVEFFAIDGAGHVSVLDAGHDKIVDWMNR